MCWLGRWRDTSRCSILYINWHHSTTHDVTCEYHCPAPVGVQSIVINRSVCVSVCLSVCKHISGTAGPIGPKFCLPIPCGRGSVLAWRCCATLCTSGFMDDVTFGRNGRDAERWGHRCSDYHEQYGNDHKIIECCNNTHQGAPCKQMSTCALDFGHAHKKALVQIDCTVFTFHESRHDLSHSFATYCDLAWLVALIL